MQSGIDNTLEIARLDSEEHSIKGGGEIVEGAVKNCHFFCFPKPLLDSERLGATRKYRGRDLSC